MKAFLIHCTHMIEYLVLNQRRPLTEDLPTFMALVTSFSTVDFLLLNKDRLWPNGFSSDKLSVINQSRP